MNVQRIQQDVIKDALSNKAGNWFIQMSDADVVLFTKYQLYLLDPKDFLLNYNKIVDAGVKETATVDVILNQADDAKPAVRTGLMRILDKKTCVELKREDTEELVYLDEKLLKYYDSPEFEVVNSKSPVYVYESDILVGVVLPVKVG